MTGARRAALAAVLAASVLAVVALTALAILSTRPVSEDELMRAAAMAAADAESPILTAAVADCRARPQAYGVDAGTAAASGCADAVAPDRAWYLGRPALDARAVAAFDQLLLGLLLMGMAGLVGLALGGTPAWSGRRVLTTSGATGAAMGVLGAGAMWMAVSLTLALRDLAAPEVGAWLQTGRAGLLTAVVCAVSALTTRRLGSAAAAVLVLGGLAFLTLWLPVDALDLAEAWLTWDGI